MKTSKKPNFMHWLRSVPPVNISKPSFFVFRGYRVGPVTINELKELEMRAWPRKKKQSVADAL